jgi:hypothetical protein
MAFSTLAKGNGKLPANPADGPVLPAIWGAKQSVSALSWASIDARVIAAALQAVTDVDHALMIGKTRNGSSVVLTLYKGKPLESVYLGTAEALEAAFLELVDKIPGPSEDLRAVFGLAPA